MRRAPASPRPPARSERRPALAPYHGPVQTRAEGPDRPAGPRGAGARRLGVVLVALGVAGIAWGALHLADRAQGGRRRTVFAQRVGYDEAKGAVHQALPGALLRSLGGLVLAVVGGRLLRRPEGA